MKRLLLFITLIFLLLSFSSKANDDWKKITEDPTYIHRAMKEITDVMVHDVYSPPVASRIYAYVSVAGYEAAIAFNKKYISLAGQLHGLNELPKPDASKQYSPGLSAVNAMLIVAKTIIISEDSIANFQNKLLNEYKQSGMPQTVYDNSLMYGKEIADTILAWASKDNYKQIKALGKYAVIDDSITWKPTPPHIYRR